jgi:hypothetical protein
MFPAVELERTSIDSLGTGKVFFFFLLPASAPMGDKAGDDVAEGSKGAGQQVVVHAVQIRKRGFS